MNSRTIVRVIVSKMSAVAHHIPLLRTWHNSGVKYWEKRVERYGARSVLNLGHSESEYQKVTEKQKAEIYPYFRKMLNGNEQVVLDFGCGPGRFTGDLAAMIRGKAIGIDPVQRLLLLAEMAENVEFRTMMQGVIPIADNSADAVWVCLVLGGIEASILTHTVKEIVRVLKAGGLLFLVENTSDKSSGSHWKFRTCNEYMEMFPLIHLVHLHDYDDLGERISIIAGRK